MASAAFDAEDTAHFAHVGKMQLDQIRERFAAHGHATHPRFTNEAVSPLSIRPSWSHTHGPR
jgi:hypothetical protein